MKNWNKSILNINSSLGQAIENLVKSSTQINLIVGKKNFFLGTLTDGDLRKAILKKVDLKTSIKNYVNYKAITSTKKNSDFELLKLMQKNGISHVPIIDNKKIIDVKSFKELLSLNSNFNDNIVLIMAGGLGQRLRPLTYKTPKPMLKINNKPLLENLIFNLNTQGFKNIIISVNYLANQIKKYFHDGKKFGVNISYIHEKNPLGTAGALSLLKKKLKKPIIVINGDVVTSIRFDYLLEFHNNHKPMMTIVVKAKDTKHNYGVIDIQGLLVKNFKEKPVTRMYYNTGIYVLDQTIVSKLKKSKFYNMPDIIFLIKKFYSNKKVMAYPLHEDWIDIGNINDLKIARYK
jgi:dTDP-glucose pyrophosphorylase